MERTLVLVKPDGVNRGLIGKVIARIENKGFRLVAVKMMQMEKELAERHYQEHQGKPFFAALVEFITSGPIVAMVWEGKGVIEGVRRLMGETDPLKALPGTIRGDFGAYLSRNIVHGSDSPAAAEREIRLFFEPGEILKYERSLEKWIFE